MAPLTTSRPVSVSPTSPGGTLSGRASNGFMTDASRVLSGLRDAIGDILAASPAEITKAIDVDRSFGVAHSLGWKMYQIANVEDSLEVVQHLPARESMERFFKAAARRGISPALLQRGSEALDDFDRFVREHAGDDRVALDAMVRSHLPEQREKYDLESRQIIYRGVSQFKGVTDESSLNVRLLHPSADGEAVDCAALTGEFGIRRSRPGSTIILGVGSPTRESSPLALDGRPCEGPMGMVLPQFSSSPLPSIEVHKLGSSLFHCVAGQDVGMRSAVDLVVADRSNRLFPRTRRPGGSALVGPAYGVDTPSKRITVEVHVHRDVYPGVRPELEVYDTSLRGVVTKCNDASRTFDRMHTRDTIHELVGGPAANRLPHIPRYVEMIEHLYTTVGWDPTQFRSYRLDVQYPMYGSQYLFGFRLPDPTE